MKKKDTVKFLICIPCYNCLETIGRLLSSIEKQHYSKLVVVICDDSDNDELSLNIFDIKKSIKALQLTITKEKILMNITALEIQEIPYLKEH